MFNKNAPSKLADSENDNDFCNTVVTFFSDKIRRIENLLKDIQPKNEENIDCIETPLVDQNSNALQDFQPVSEDDIRKLINSSSSKSCLLDSIQRIDAIAQASLSI